MTNELDTKLSQLKTLEDSIEKLTTEKESIRKEIFDTLQKENLSQYKTDVATISQVERKTIKYIKPVEEVISYLKEQKLVKYFSVIPEVITPEHEELNKNFEKDVKEGVYKLEGVELDTKSFPSIRFN